MYALTMIFYAIAIIHFAFTDELASGIFAIIFAVFAVLVRINEAIERKR